MGVHKPYRPHEPHDQWWICIDESGNETIHQIEPHYNRLQKRWKSQAYIYVSKGMVNLVISQNDISKIKDDKVVAGAFEVISLGQKAIVRETLKIFK